MPNFSINIYTDLAASSPSRVFTEEDVTDISINEDISTNNIASLQFVLHSFSGSSDIHSAFVQLRNILIPHKTYVSVNHLKLGCIFTGRLHSAQETTNQNGAYQVIFEDMRSCLRDSFIVYGPQYDDDEDASTFRGREGESANALLGQIAGAHNTFVTYLGSISNTNYPTCGVFFDDNYTLKEDVTLEGSSTLEAFQTVVDSINCEWRARWTLDGIQIEIGKKLSRTIDNQQIRTGLNLSELTMKVDTASIATAILPYGGFGYNDHRLVMAENDYDTQSALMINQTMANLFGIIPKIVTFDNIVANGDDELAEKRLELQTKAQEEVDKLSEDSVEFTLSVYDLYSMLPAGVTGNYVNAPILCWATYKLVDFVTDVNIDVRVTKSSMVLNDFSQSTYTFSAKSIDILTQLGS